MLLKTDKLNESTYELSASFEGKKYEDALMDYPSYIEDFIRDSYENPLFPKGKVPIEVNEELNGDELYKKIFKGNFMNLYQDTIREAGLNNVHLEKIIFKYFSREKIIFSITVSCYKKNDNNDGNEANIINDIVDNELAHISNINKLLINSKIKRDKYFWKDLQEVCTACQKNIVQELTPVLSKLGILNLNNDAICIDVSDSNPMLSMYPIIEILLFPCSVFSAALHEYIHDFTIEDEYNLKKYIFSTVDELLEMPNQFEKSIKETLIDRLNEYNLACKKGLTSGLSLYGQFGMDFEGLNDWSQNHQVKCAHILCDHIAYIQHFHQIGTYEDLNKLRPIVVNNSKQTLKIFMELFHTLHITSGSIFMIVRGALNGGRKLQWKAKGLCQYCGRELKKGLFISKCPVCKIKKDY